MPQALRLILEKALSEDASQENLDRYLPSIREIIVTLLRQLKEKQMLIRSQAHNSQMNQHPVIQRKYSAGSGPPQIYPGATAPATSGYEYPSKYTTGLSGPSPISTTAPSPSINNPPGPGSQFQPSHNQPRNKHSSGSLNSASLAASRHPAARAEPMQSSNSNSSSNGRPTQQQQQSYGAQQSPVSSHAMTQSISSSSASSNLSFSSSTGDGGSPAATLTPSGRPPYAQHVRNKSSLTGTRSDLEHMNLTRKDPLAALQRGEALERRASRRFSAYQFAKLTNGSITRTEIPDVPPLPGNGAGSGMGIAGSRGPPPGHPSPYGAHYIPPNSSVLAMPTGNYLPTKSPRSTHAAEYTSSTMIVSDGKNMPHGPDGSGAPGSSLAAARAAISGATAVGTNSNGPLQQYPTPTSNDAYVSATRSKSAPSSGKDRPLSLIQQQQQYAQDNQKQTTQQPTSDQQQKFQAPSDPNKLVLFLQIGRSVKKCLVDRSDLTIPALRLLFVDRFAYPMSSEAIPDIYIQDPTSGIRYELDEDGLANDVHQGSLISLNVEAVDEVKKHIDTGFATLTKHITDLNSKVTAHSASIQKINELQESIAQKSYRTSGSDHGHLKKTSFGGKPRHVSISTTPSRTNSVNSAAGLSSSNSENLRKMESLRRELTSVKKVSADAISGMRDSIAELLTKAQTLQSIDSLPPPGDSSRSFMERSFKKLTGDADKLLTDVDDLQDIIEDLRKDVAQRGVRPEGRRLENVSNDVQTALKNLDSISDYIKSEKAGWKKIWERELDKICEEQQILKFHEEIIVDLKDDLIKAEETFDLVKQCSTEAIKNSSFRQVYLPPPIEGQSVVTAKDAVLNEVVALQPNHEQRLEAIERAEKKRKKELQSRGIGTNSFLRELTSDAKDLDEPLPERVPKEKDLTKKKKKKSSVAGEEKKKKKKKSKKPEDETSVKKKKKKHSKAGEEDDDDEEAGAKNNETSTIPEATYDDEVDDDDDEEEEEDDDEALGSKNTASPNVPSTPTLDSKSLAPPNIDGSAATTASGTASGASRGVRLGTSSPTTPGSASSRKVQSLLLDSSEDLTQLSPAIESSKKLQMMTSENGLDSNHLSSSSTENFANTTDHLSFHSASSPPRDSIIMPLSTSHKGNGSLPTGPFDENETFTNKPLPSIVPLSHPEQL